MEKNLLNELNEMKFLFGYKRGKVISEQSMIDNYDEEYFDDVLMSEPDVAEPETKPKTRPRPDKPDTDPFPNPFDPDRGKEFNPLPDAEPQGKLNSKFKRNIYSDGMSGMMQVDSSEINEPFIDDVKDENEYELEYDIDDDDIMGKKEVGLENLVNKYLRNKDENETIYEIHINTTINDLLK